MNKQGTIRRVSGGEKNCDRPIRSIIFDLDGTLVDSVQGIGCVLNAMRGERGLKPLALDAFRLWVSLGASELLRRSLEIGPEQLAGRVEEFRLRYRANPTLAEHLYPGVPETLQELVGRDIRLAICSNKPTPLCRKIVDEMNLADYFDEIVGGEPDRPAKPHPAPLYRALEATRADADTSFFVGDSTIDQRTAAAVAVPFVFFTAGYDDGVDRSSAYRVIGLIREILGFVPQVRTSWRQGS